MDETKAREVLELGRNLTERSLKRAYREQLMVWHPDRFAGQSARMCKRAERRTQEINEAREFLIAHLKKPASANQKSNIQRNKARTKKGKGRTKARSQRSEAKPPNAFDKNRKRHGLWGFRDSATGKFIWKGTYKNGKKHGAWENYHVNGRLKQTSTYKNGKKHFIWKNLYKNGRLKQTSVYKNGKKHGIWESYYRNGYLKETSTYRADLLHGWWASFKEDGELKAKGNFKSGERCGEWYDEMHFHLFNWSGLRNYGPCPRNL